MESLAPVTTVPIYRRPPRPKTRPRHRILSKSKQRLAKTVSSRPGSRESKKSSNSTDCSSASDVYSRSSYDSTGLRNYSLATNATDQTVELPPAGPLSPLELVGDSPVEPLHAPFAFGSGGGADPHPGTPWDWAKRKQPKSKMWRRSMTALTATATARATPTVTVTLSTAKGESHGSGRGGRGGRHFAELEGDAPPPPPPPASVRSSDTATTTLGIADAEFSPADKLHHLHPRPSPSPLQPLPQPRGVAAAATVKAPSSPPPPPPPPPLKLFPSPPRQATPPGPRGSELDLRPAGRSHAASTTSPTPPSVLITRAPGAVSRTETHDQHYPLARSCPSPLSSSAAGANGAERAASSPAPRTPTTRRPSTPPPPPPPKPFSYYAAKKMAPHQASGYTVGSGVTAMNPAATYQHIQDMAAKRISTLDYLRKTHEGRVYWFNTLLFSQPDIMRLPSFQAPRLARRASNLLLLGLSIPVAVDASGQSALEYIRALNALLAEFEAYQQLHPTEGGGSSIGGGSFSRAKLPKMKFSRGSVGGKNRRASTATDIGLPLPPGFDSVVGGGHHGAEGQDSLASSTASLAGGGGNSISAASGTTLVGSIGGGSQASGPRQPGTNTAALPAPDASMLLPGEEYSYLLTPSIPFEPDFFEVFATLSEVLIDVYMRIAALVPSPEKVALQPGLAEAFAKADARIRKLLVLGIVKEFEESTRTGVKGEMAGVGRVVLGGLM